MLIALERFLFRLGISSSAEQFVLKDALLYFVWDNASVHDARSVGSATGSEVHEYLEAGWPLDGEEVSGYTNS